MGATTLAARTSDRMRRRRAVIIKTLIADIVLRKGHCHVLDVGGEAAYWNKVDLTLLPPHAIHITLAQGPWAPPTLGLDPDLFTATTADGCNLPYSDNQFDLVHSNSVVEHVGDWARMQAFAGQVRRLAPSYYVQTPYFWFPYEPHFGCPAFHWLPESTRVALLTRRAMGHYPKADSVSVATEWAQSARLLDRQQMASLFPDAVIRREKFCGLTKSLIAIR